MFKTSCSSVSLRVLAILTLATHAGCSHETSTSPQNASLLTTPSKVGKLAPMDPVIAQIRDEGLNRSKVMDTLDYLCNVIGPRLTASPNGIKASNWARETLESWGLTNAHMEEWGPFGIGWTLKRYSLQMTYPVNNTLISFPKAWSPGITAPIETEVVYLNASKQSELDAFKGRLAGKIVLIGDTREVPARFEPIATRRTDEDLAKMAINPTVLAASDTSKGDEQPRQITAAERRAQFAAGSPNAETLMRRRRPSSRPATTQSNTPTTAQTPAKGLTAQDLFNFAAEQKAALVLTPSTKGDAGTLFVAGISVPGTATTRPKVWMKPAADAPYCPPQAVLTIEDHNRFVSLIKHDVTPKLAFDLQVETSPEDQTSFNTIAEIPGTDPKLKDEIVMVGAHLDSWHSSGGATDNGAGSAAAMEAIRIIKALNLKPRRTIRVALWTGEEQGLHGSREYVARHFATNADGTPATTKPTTQPLAKKTDYEKLSVYFNLDNGTGQIRGVFCQGNTAAAPIFSQWLIPFHDLGAKTVTMNNTGGTDHLSFDNVNLPGFQFIQDAIEYAPKTHHSNQDNYDRIQAKDMQISSTIMAAFLWNAANMEERFPRKPEN